MNHKKNKFILSGALLFAPLIVLADEDAGRLDKRFEKPPETKSSLQPLLLPLGEQIPPDKAGKIKFVLKELRLTGNTVFSKEELGLLYTELLGKEISLLDIYQVRDAITAKYGNAGFGLSKAVVPQQKIQANGLVNMEIIEGFVDEVIIEGATDEQQDYLAHAAEQIKAERPLNAKTLERYLLLANDRFAIKVTSTLKQSEKTPAASTLILKVEKAKLIDGGASIDNRGTHALGPNQVNANLAVNGLFGRASQTALNYSTTLQSSELKYIAVSHNEILNAEGTMFSFAWSGSKSAPGTPVLRLLNVKNESTDWSLTVSHPLIRTRQENLSGHIKYEHRNVESQAVSTLTMEDKIRSLRFGVNYDRADAFAGINQVLFEYSFGIGVQSATSNNSALKSRADGKSDYQKLTVNLSRRQELGYFASWLSQFSVNTSMMGQYSVDGGLLSSEECGLGGRQFGRAYDYSEILGDSCLAGSLELAFTPDFLKIAPLQYAQFYGFYDGGFTNNATPLSVNDTKTKSLMSAGLGFRFGITEYLSGSIEGTQPLTRVVANKENREPRVFANIAVRF